MSKWSSFIGNKNENYEIFIIYATFAFQEKLK